MLRKSIRLSNEYLLNVHLAQGKWTYERWNSGAAALCSSAGPNAQLDSPQTREPAVPGPASPVLPLLPRRLTPTRHRPLELRGFNHGEMSKSVSPML